MTFTLLLLLLLQLLGAHSVFGSIIIVMSSWPARSLHVPFSAMVGAKLPRRCDGMKCPGDFTFNAWVGGIARLGFRDHVCASVCVCVHIGLPARQLTEVHVFISRLTLDSDNANGQSMAHLVAM